MEGSSWRVRLKGGIMRGIRDVRGEAIFFVRVRFIYGMKGRGGRGSNPVKSLQLRDFSSTSIR